MNAKRIIGTTIEAAALATFVGAVLLIAAPARAETTAAKCDTDSACAAYERKATKAPALLGVYVSHNGGRAPDGLFFCTYSKGQSVRLCK
jgi:hypothetical protein